MERPTPLHLNEQEQIAERWRKEYIQEWKSILIPFAQKGYEIIGRGAMMVNFENLYYPQIRYGAPMQYVTLSDLESLVNKIQFASLTLHQVQQYDPIAQVAVCLKLPNPHDTAVYNRSSELRTYIVGADFESTEVRGYNEITMDELQSSSAFLKNIRS